MSLDNKRVTYFLIPIQEITDEMINSSCQTNRGTVRKSIRPIDNKIHGLISFLGLPPNYMNCFKPYSNEEIRSLITTKEWNVTQPIDELKERYNFERIINQINEDNIIQAYGETYITIFELLKFKFFLMNYTYLDSEEKWKLFKGNRFEKINESTLLDLNYFYNLITLKEKQKIDGFRVKRNNVAHSFQLKYDKSELCLELKKMNELITKYLDELSYSYEQF